MRGKEDKIILWLLRCSGVSHLCFVPFNILDVPAGINESSPQHASLAVGLRPSIQSVDIKKEKEKSKEEDTYPGTCVLLQVGVNAPGTPIKITLFPAINEVICISILSCKGEDRIRTRLVRVW